MRNLLDNHAGYRVVATNDDGCYLVITRQYIDAADYAVINVWDGRLYNVVEYHPHGIGAFSTADTAESICREYNIGGWASGSDTTWFIAETSFFIDTDGHAVEGQA